MMKLYTLLTLVLLAIGALSFQATADPIHDAAAKGNVNKVTSLLASSARLVNATDKTGATPLHYAVAAGKNEMVTFLISRKANVNARKKNGVTPLHIAAAMGYENIVKALIKVGADTQLKDELGRTPADLAKEKGLAKIVDLLTKNPVSISGAKNPLKQIKAYWLDMASPEDDGEQILATTLQGLVNRDASRLFFRTHFWVYPPSDEYWKKYLSEEKGYQFETLPSLAAAIEKLKSEKLFDGLVIYNSANWRECCVAATMAAQRNLLPVTQEILNYQSPLLSGKAYWTEDDMTQVTWQENCATSKFTDEGLVVVPMEGVPQGGAERIVCYDPKTMPFVEITVTKCTGRWALQVDDCSTNPVWVSEPTSAVGTFRYDLRKLLTQSDSRVIMRVCPVGKGSSVTARRLRFLDENNQLAKREYKKVECFRDMKVVEDIRGRFQNDAEAYRWALDNLMPQCTKKMAFEARSGWWNILGLDLAIKDKLFIFYDAIDKDDTPIFNEVMQSLNHPAGILGWDEPEWKYEYKISENGNFILCSGAPNLSFWAHVPTDGRVSLRKAELPPRELKEKYYVLFQISDGDAPKTAACLYISDGPALRSESAWLSPDRGKVPIAWGIQPYLMDICPALLEYYSKTATANDSFFAGPSGAGYCSPNKMPDLAQFGQHTRRWMQEAGVRMVDMWDRMEMGRGEKLNSLYNGMSNYSKIDAYSVMPMGFGWNAQNWWLDDGTPIVMADRISFGKSLWMLDILDLQDPVGDLTGRILKASEVQDPPFFINILSHISPSIMKNVQDRLPSDKYEFIGVDDFMKLARKAGEFTATRKGAGCWSGPSGRGGIEIEVILRNPDGKSGNPGTVNCTAPDGWWVSERNWDYDSIPEGGLLRRRFTIVPVNIQAKQVAKVIFQDSSHSFKRKVSIDAYPDCQAIGAPNPQTWSIEYGASVVQKNDMVYITAPASSGKVVKDMSLDFDRNPVLALDVPDIETEWTAAIYDGRQSYTLLDATTRFGILTFDLAQISGWQGKKDFTLTIWPRTTNRGAGIYLRNVEVYYSR